MGCFITSLPSLVPCSVLCCFLCWLQLWPVLLLSLLQLPLVLCSYLSSCILYACLYLPMWDYDYFCLPIWDYASLCQPIWDFCSWQQAVFLASVKRTLCHVYKHICCYYVYLSKNHGIVMCACLYIQWWCILSVYIQDASWLL